MLSRFVLAWATMALCSSSVFAVQHHRNIDKVRVVSQKHSGALLEEEAYLHLPKDEGKANNLVSHAVEDDPKGNGLIAEAVPMLPERNEAYDQSIFNDVGIHTLSHSTAAGTPQEEEKEGEGHELNRREDPHLHEALDHHDHLANSVFDTQGTPGLDHSFEQEDHQLHAQPAHTSSASHQSAPAPAPSPAKTNNKSRKHSQKQSHQVKGRFAPSEGAAEDTTLIPDYYEANEFTEEGEDAAEGSENSARASKGRGGATKKYSSCADKCKGEGEITDALKAGKKTPQCLSISSMTLSPMWIVS